MLSTVTLASLSLLTPPSRVGPSTSRACVQAPAPSAVAAGGQLSRRDLLSSAASAALATAAVVPLPAMAESTLVTRQQAYTRYVPRIERGRDFWAGGLKKYIASQEWEKIKAELEPVGKNKGGAIMKTVGPMKLWASSFSGKTISEKTLAMNEAIEELTEAITSLEVAANGKEKDGGLFGVFGGQKSIEPAKRQKLAQLAYLKGANAINKYIEIGNDGLGLNFATIDTID